VYLKINAGTADVRWDKDPLDPDAERQRKDQREALRKGE
jgi:hypothetical protein